MDIKLSKGQSAIIDDEDFGVLSKFKWHLHHGYAETNIMVDGKYRTRSMHRMIMGFPANNIDHINGNRLDNRKCNLRTCTKAQNNMNVSLRKTNKTGYKGVSFNKRLNKYVVRISLNGKDKHVGCFQTLKEAVEEYNSQAIIHFGEFAKLNVYRDLFHVDETEKELDELFGYPI